MRSLCPIVSVVYGPGPWHLFMDLTRGINVVPCNEKGLIFPGRRKNKWQKQGRNSFMEEEERICVDVI